MNSWTFQEPGPSSFVISSTQVKQVTTVSYNTLQHIHSLHVYFSHVSLILYTYIKHEHRVYTCVKQTYDKKFQKYY